MKELELSPLAYPALDILEKNLDVVPLSLKDEKDGTEQTFDVTMELKGSISDPVNELILPACSMLAMRINNEYPIDGCEFIRLGLLEKTKSCISWDKGISIRLEKKYNTKKECEELSISVCISKKINSLMDLSEWDIKTTSDKCLYRICVKQFNTVTGLLNYDPVEQCNHPYNETKACIKDNCPEKI